MFVYDIITPVVKCLQIMSEYYSHSGCIVKCRGIGRCGRVNKAKELETGPVFL